MALKTNFYNEIFIQEQKWIELINKNLLNSIYCNLTLKPFYEAKKLELEKEYKLTNNEIIGHFIPIIDNIISKIELFNKQYNNSKFVDVKSLLPLLFSNQMNNISQKENKSIKQVDEEINRLQIRKQILESINNNNREESQDFDYLYDDFPEEQRKVK